MFSPIVLPKGSLQLENGLLYQGLRRGRSSFDLPETQVRLGIGNTTEFQSSVPNFVVLNGANNRTYGTTDLVEIGIKQQLRKDPGRFNAAIVADLTVPTGTRVSVLVAPRRLFVCRTAPDALVSRNLGSKASVFMEYAGFFAPHLPSINILHFGAVYKLSKLQQIDGRFGIGLNEIAPSAFVGCGYSRRFDDLF